MKSVEFWWLSYLLNSLWQVPLLFAAGWCVARALRPVSEVAEHRVWVFTLLAQSLLPGLSLLPWTWLRALTSWGGQGVAEQAHVSVVIGAGAGLAAVPVPDALLTALALFYGAVSLYFVARFVWRGANLIALRKEAVQIALSERAAAHWAQCTQRFAIMDVSIAASSRVQGPVTLGIRRKLILLPAGMLDTLPESDLYTVIAHEFAHLRRKDFFKNLVYELFALPVSYHPLLWLTRENIMQSREMVCDQMAAGITGRTEYARSLLRLASLLIRSRPVTTPHAIGIFDANAFERRVMKLAEQETNIRGVRRAAVVAACICFALGTCVSVLALAIHVDAGAADHDSAPSKNPSSLNVSASVMAGNLLSKAVPIYPPAAKKAKIQGAVVLEAVIGKDGNVKNLRVVSGPQELQQSAIDAVRQWVYRPYLLNGDPIEVVTNIHVVYSLKG